MNNYLLRRFKGKLQYQSAYFFQQNIRITHFSLIKISVIIKSVVYGNMHFTFSFSSEKLCEYNSLVASRFYVNQFNKINSGSFTEVFH